MLTCCDQKACSTNISPRSYSAPSSPLHTIYQLHHTLFLTNSPTRSHPCLPSSDVKLPPVHGRIAFETVTRTPNAANGHDCGDTHGPCVSPINTQYTIQTQFFSRADQQDRGRLAARQWGGVCAALVLSRFGRLWRSCTPQASTGISPVGCDPGLWL